MKNSLNVLFDYWPLIYIFLSPQPCILAYCSPPVTVGWSVFSVICAYFILFYFEGLFTARCYAERGYATVYCLSVCVWQHGRSGAICPSV